MATQSPAHSPPTFTPTLVLGIGIVAVSTASTFIRLAQVSVSSLAVAAWRLTIASLMLAPFALRTCRQEWKQLTAGSWRWLALSGVMLAIHFYTWIVSLETTSVAASTVLVSTNPLFVGLISHFALQERVHKRLAMSIFIALIGSAIIGLVDWRTGTHQLLGDLLAVAGAASVAIYMIIGRGLRKRLSLLGYIFPVYGIAAITLMALALIVGVPLAGYPTQAWVWLALLAVFPQIIGHSSYNWALGHLPATYVSLSVLAEPIGSTILAWIILKEPASWVTVGGGLLILISLVVAMKRDA